MSILPDIGKSLLNLGSVTARFTPSGHLLRRKQHGLAGKASVPSEEKPSGKPEKPSP